MVKAITASRLIDGRCRSDRTEGIGLKISKEKRGQFDRLRMLTRLSYTEILEQALDSLEAAWHARHGEKR
jgi:hypothetical protein